MIFDVVFLIKVDKMMLNTLSLICFLLIPKSGHFIKKVSVVSEKDELYMDRTSEVRCSFTKWKREQLLSVTWSDMS